MKGVDSVNIKYTLEFTYLEELYEQRAEAQRTYENYLMQIRKLKWYQFKKRKWCRYRINSMRKIIEGWDLMISINARRLVERIKDEGE